MYTYIIYYIYTNNDHAKKPPSAIAFEKTKSKYNTIIISYH